MHTRPISPRISPRGDPHHFPRQANAVEFATVRAQELGAFCLLLADKLTFGRDRAPTDRTEKRQRDALPD